jgi:hypothetical protein
MGGIDELMFRICDNLGFKVMEQVLLGFAMKRVARFIEQQDQWFVVALDRRIPSQK